MAEHPMDNAPRDGTDILLWGRLEQKPAFDGDVQFSDPAWYVGVWLSEETMDDAGWYVLAIPIEPTRWHPLPDEHRWDGEVVVIGFAELATCSRCGCDPSEDRANRPCEGAPLSVKDRQTGEPRS